MKWENMEALVHFYEHSIFAQPFQKTEDDATVLPVANMTFTKPMRGQEEKTKLCQICQKSGHLAKDYSQGFKNSGGKKGPNDRSEDELKLLYEGTGHVNCSTLLFGGTGTLTTKILLKEIKDRQAKMSHLQ